MSIYPIYTYEMRILLTNGNIHMFLRVSFRIKSSKVMRNGYISKIQKKSWIYPCKQSTPTARPNCFKKKTMFCIW